MKALIKNIFFNIWKVFKPKTSPSNIFLMAHPRSGSSLLMHILTTNKDILGFGEYHIIYTSKNDLLKAEFDIRRKSNIFFKKYFYIANQILHSSRTPNLGLMNSKKIKIIFLIRKPEETLSSLATISKSVKGFVNKQEIVDLYIRRLYNISKTAKSLDNKQWIFLTYNDLIEKDEKTLILLSQFLSLKTPLCTSYKLQKFTQVTGDPSKNIRKGAIFKTNSKQVEFSEEYLKPAQEAYQKTLNILYNCTFNS